MISTLLPGSLFLPMSAVAQPQPETINLAALNFSESTASPSDAEESLLSSFMNEDFGIEVTEPLPTAAPEISTEDLSPSMLDSEQRLRLARFLPDRSTPRSHRHVMDMLLAKVETRSGSSPDRPGGIRIYRGGTLQSDEVPETTFHEDEAGKESVSEVTDRDEEDSAAVLLASADALLAQGAAREAFNSYFDIVNLYPESAAADQVDEVIHSLLWDLDHKQLDGSSLSSFTDALPTFEKCNSEKAVFWLAALNHITGSSLLTSESSEKARSYFTQCRDICAAAIKEYPDSPFQLFFPGYFLSASSSLSRRALDEGMAELQQVMIASSEDSLLRFSARHCLGMMHNREYNDIVESGMQFSNLLDEYPGSEAETLVGNKETKALFSSHVFFTLGYIHYQLAQFSTARSYFDQVAEADESNLRLMDAAAYMSAHMTELMDLYQTERIVSAYGKYMETWPDGLYVDKTLMRLAVLFERRGELRDALSCYERFLELFPESSWVPSVKVVVADLNASIESGAETQWKTDQFVQNHGMEWCGPYALALFLEDQGLDNDLWLLSEMSGLDSEGTSLAGLKSAAAEAGLSLYGVEIEKGEEIPTPAIAHLEAGHFVYVSQSSSSSLIIEDIYGERSVSRERFDLLFSGHLLVSLEVKSDNWITESMLETLRGGIFMPSDMNETYAACINQDFIPDRCEEKDEDGCPTNCMDENGSMPSYPDFQDGQPLSGAPASNNPTSSPWSRGSYAPSSIHKAPHIALPGAMPTPGSPTMNPNIPFGGGALSVAMGTNHRAVTITQQDFKVSTRGPVDFVFTRTYYNPWGGHKNYMNSEDRPFKNNCGSGWHHNLNVHLRFSSQNGALIYLDAHGNFKRFLRVDSANGFDIYKRAPFDFEGGDTNALRTEKSIVIRRHIQQGWSEMAFSSGLTCRFSTPINNEDRYCRLESITDVSGNTFSLNYTSLLRVGMDNITTNFGQLSQVHFPEGDNRYIQFSYEGNRITKVALLQPCTGGTQELKKVEYTYGPHKNGQSGEQNFLRKVVSDGNTDSAVRFEYGKGGHGNWIWGVYPSKIRDREGNELHLDFEYGYVSGNSFVSTTKIKMTYPNGLKTVFTKTAHATTLVENFDGATPLSKYQYYADAHAVQLAGINYYKEADGGASDWWSFGYSNNYDLVSIPALNVGYTYNSDGRVTSYSCDGVFYRYEYPTGGGLYPVSLYGPGSQYNYGPKTEFVYDALDRLIQLKSPHMGPAGLTITYDAYGQVISRTDAAGNTRSYSYDGRGNMLTHTDQNNKTWSFAYDDLGRMVSQTNPLNQTSLYGYTDGCQGCGAAGLIESVTRPDNSQFFFEYNNNGQLIRQTDPQGKETVYEYDTMGQLISLTTTEGRKQQFYYDKLGQMIRHKDFGGTTHGYEYNHLGLMTRAWIQQGAEEDTLVQNEYDMRGWLLKVIDGEGQDINYAYNNRGQVIRTSHGHWCPLLGEEDCSHNFGALHIHNTYDTFGLVRSRAESRYPTIQLSVDPVEYTYDNTTGQVIRKRTSNNNGAVVRDIDYQYDNTGQLIQLKDWAGGAASDGHFFSYDASGQLTLYTDYDGATLSYNYDALGRPVAMNAYEGGNNYAYGYNTAGQLSTVTAPGNKQWNFSYDVSGKLVDYTWPNGQKTEYDYDDDGVVKELLHKSGSAIKSGWTYEHNKSGAIRQIRDARPGNDEGWDYAYDHRGRLVQAIRQNNAGDPTVRMNYSWDRADNMLSQTRYNLTSRMKDNFSDGNYTVNPVWTVESGTWNASSGALASGTDAGEKAIYTANSYGNADFWYSFRRTDGGGIFDHTLVQLRYVNEDNWLGIRWLWGMLEILEVVDGTQRSLAVSGQNFLDQDQWYDLYVQLDGNQVTLYSAERGGDQKKLLSTQTTLPVTTNRLRVRVNGTIPFEFDDFRICSRTVPGTHSMAYTYGKANQLESVTTGGMTSFFTYDPWGRLATRTATVGNQQYTATYTWRFGDKLQRIDSTFPGEPPVVLYNYDGLGKRRIKAVGDETHYWRWDAGYNVVAEYKDQTPSWDVGALERFFVPFGHTALAEATPGAGGSMNNAAYTYLAHDHLGTTRKGYNQAKTEIHSNEHLPFGQRFFTTGTVPYHEWTGKPWDAESQMYYFPYRYYSPIMNRWTAVDPLGLVDGPNLYGYVRGNPIMHIDPEGGSLFGTAFLVFSTGLFVAEIITAAHNKVLVDQQGAQLIEISNSLNSLLDNHGCNEFVMSEVQELQKWLKKKAVGKEGFAGWFVNDVFSIIVSLFN